MKYYSVYRWERIKHWIDEQYRFLMLAGMLLEIALIAYLAWRAH